MKAKKILSVLLAVVFMFSFMSISVMAEETVTTLTGEGTETSPYLIGNLEDLKWFRDDVNAGNNYSGKCVKLTADIDLKDEEWTPIGYEGDTFVGNFDGDNHTIKNLKITKTTDNTAANNGIGFFGRTDSPATIKNLKIENVDITGSLYVGAIVGLGHTGKLIENCTVKGNIAIDAWWYAGVIGGNGYMNLVNNCHVIGNDGSYIKGNDGSYIGGIWGFRGEGANNITNCTVTNLSITGVDRVGGICGIGHYGNTISGCTAEKVAITATDPEATTVGLIVGACQGNSDGPTTFTNNIVTDTTAKVGEKEVTSLYGTNIDGSTPVTNYVAEVNGTQHTALAAAVEAATAGDTVRLINDATTSETIVINKAITLDLNGKTVNAAASLANAPVFRILDNVTVTNGTVDGTTGINSYAFIVGNSTTAGTLTIADGTYKGVTSAVSITNGTANISGGTFATGHDDEGTDYGATYLLNCVDAAYKNGTAKYNITGGTFVGFNPADNLAEGANTVFTADGYSAAKNADGTYTVAIMPNAEVNSLGVTTIDEYYVFTGEWPPAVSTEPITVPVVMEFIAKDTEETATANAFGDYTTDFFITIDGIENGSFIADGCYLVGNYGIYGWVQIPLDGMTIEDGKIYPVLSTLGEAFDFSYVDICTSVQNFKCGICFTDEVLEDNPNLTVTLELGLSENQAEAVAANYATVDQPYVYDVEDLTIEYVAQVGETKYTSLQAAIDAANAGDTITLLSNITTSETFTVAADDKITLDLAGYTVSYTTDVAGEAMITNKGDLTITDSSTDKSGKISFTYAGNADSNFSKGNYTISNGGKLTVEAGTIENNTAKMSHAYYAIDNNSINSSAELVINGGSVVNNTNYAIRQIAGVNKNTVTVNDGTVTGTRAVWMQLAGSDSAVAPEVTLDVKGGKLTGTGESSDYKLAVYSYSYGNSLKNTKVNITGGTLVGDIALTGGKNKTVAETVTITNGAITDVYSYANAAVAAETINISGGTFSNEIADVYLADGFTCEANEDGTYGVVEEITLDTRNLTIINMQKVTDSNGVERFRVAFSSGIDSLDYEEVGFEISVPSLDWSTTLKTKTVYNSLTVNRTDGTTKKYTPDMFGDDCEYIFYKTAQFGERFDNQTFQWRPYAITLDGTPLYGKTTEVEDIYTLNTISTDNEVVE